MTTLEGARALRGDRSISAIRVKGINRLTPATQQKIEAVATEIYQKTGLTVDIMVGSSPRWLLVHVPEVGYVEEQRIQKGVRTVYQMGVERGHWLLVRILLFIRGLFAFEFANTDIIARSREVALLKALRWYPRTLLQIILTQILLVAGAGIGGGVLFLWGMAAFSLLRFPTWPLVGSTVVLLFVTSLIGMVFPAIMLVRQTPIYGLRWGYVRYTQSRTSLWR